MFFLASFFIIMKCDRLIFLLLGIEFFFFSLLYYVFYLESTMFFYFICFGSDVISGVVGLVIFFLMLKVMVWMSYCFIFSMLSLILVLVVLS